MALPSALMLASMMLTTSAVWLEASIAHVRYDANVHDHVRAMHAAESALTLCERHVRAGLAPILPARLGAPMHWRMVGTFEGPSVYEPIRSWPGSARAPQCVIEAAPVDGERDAPILWLTARGFGGKPSTQVWLQLTLAREAGRERRAWRRIVAGLS